MEFLTSAISSIRTTWRLIGCSRKVSSNAGCTTDMFDPAITKRRGRAYLKPSTGGHGPGPTYFGASAHWHSLLPESAGHTELELRRTSHRPKARPTGRY